MPNLIELLQLYGVFIVFAIVLVEQGGLPIPAFPILVLAGAQAAVHAISWPAALAAAVLACLIADLFWFQAGRNYGAGVLRLLCKISLSPDSCVRQTEDRFARFGARSLIVSKFIPGFNVIASPMSGALGVTRARFLVFSITGSLLWSATGIALGAAFHDSVGRLLDVMSAMGTSAILVLAALLGLFVLYKYLERRRLREAMAIDRVAVSDVLALIDSGEEPLLVDARSATARELDAAIPGAAIFDARTPDGILVGVDRARHIIVYCNCPNDVTAAQVARQFMAHGFHRARPLKGGLDAWKAHHGGAVHHVE